MTLDFVKNALIEITGLSNPMNQWLTLTGQVQRIGMLSDNNIGVDLRYRMFYFDSTSEMVYIKYLTGKIYESSTVPTGYISFTYNGKNYVAQVASGGNNSNNTIGRFHSCVSFDKITAFFYPDNDSQQQRYLEEIRDGI